MRIKLGISRIAAKIAPFGMASSDTTHFSKSAIAAFPPSCRTVARSAAKTLLPFVDESYAYRKSEQVVVLGETVHIPERIHFLRLNTNELRARYDSWPAIQCLCTRSTDGYVRQSSLRRILENDEPWTVPFVVLLSGEYVVEIIADMVAALPTLNRDAYANFVHENRPLMRALKAKSISYWNCYYRESFPDRSTYPGLVFLHQLEHWAT